MHRSHNYPRRKRIAHTRETPFTPGADSSLKKVFGEIGVPERRDFRPDPFQVEALEAIRYADCLVTAPTGSGKTWIAEQAIARVLARNGRAWYACPLKALSNSKYIDFGRLFGTDQVGILTGDRKENPDAPVTVGTTEILRNQLYDAMHRGESLDSDFVVIDEAHFLGDGERGVVWEEVMIYLPARIPLLLLSATIGNARRIAEWLASIRDRACVVVEETRRPVPLFPLFLHPGGLLLPLTAQSRKDKGRQQPHPLVSDFMGRSARRFPRRGRLPPFGRVLDVLRRYDLLPAIFFLKSRADCDQALEGSRDNVPDDPLRRNRLRARIAEFASQSPRLARHRQLPFLQEQAIGAHHAGQLPSWKLMLERLMTEGLLDAVFATTTVAAGVNFPARTIVQLNSDRFNGTQFLPLDPTEFHQMTGRAGRRGMDNIGFVLVIPGRFMDVGHMVRLIKSTPSDVVSQIRINFSMALNLLMSHPPQQIEDLLRRSFAAYQLQTARRQRRTAAEAHAPLWADFHRHLRFLRAAGYVNDRDELTEEGRWASRLRVDQPLLIAEGFRQNAFPRDPALLAAIIAVFVNERECDDRIDPCFLTKTLVRSYQLMTRRLSSFLKDLLTCGFEGRAFYLRPAAAMYVWAKGSSWEQAVEVAEMEEGDLAMLVLRTADNLRHIAGLAEFFPETADAAARAVVRLLREPVKYE
jgi:ATP-dependent RNA helicase HelY